MATFLVRSKARRPQGIRADEIEAMLEAVPDLRDELREATAHPALVDALLAPPAPDVFAHQRARGLSAKRIAADLSVLAQSRG